MITQERFQRIKKTIESEFRWTLHCEISLEENKLIAKLRPNLRKQQDPTIYINNLIEILSLLKDQFELEPEIRYYNFLLQANYTRELAVIARVKYDALSNSPKPIYFKALENVPPTEHQLHDTVQKELQKALALSCNEPTLRIKLVDGPLGHLFVKFDGRQQKKIQENLPKLTHLITPIKDEHILASYAIRGELEKSYGGYYVSRNAKTRNRWAGHYHLCRNHTDDLLQIANQLGCDTSIYLEQRRKQTELRRFGC